MSVPAQIVRGRVVGAHRNERHSFSKEPVSQVDLVAGLGVEGDAHAGALVKHRSLPAVIDRTRPGPPRMLAGVMGVVVQSGAVTVGDRIEAVLPPLPHRHLEPV